MGRQGLWAAGIITLTTLVGCTSPSLVPTNEPLNGKAYLDAPLDGAKVAVESPSGSPVDTGSTGTTLQGRFFAQLSLLPSPSADDSQGLASYLPLTVKVSGGTYNGTAFDGTLLGYLPEFTATPNVPVNILTTLIVKYMQAAGVSYAQADAAVTSGLGLPANLRLAAKLNNPNYWRYLNPTRFMALAKANGGFDAFTDKIVANLIQTQKPGFALVGEGDAAPAIGSKVASWIGENTCSGLVAWGVGEVMGWILNGFSTQDPTQEALDQIESELNTMNSTLTTIQTEVGTLTTEVANLMNEMNLEWADLLTNAELLSLSNAETTIQNEYEALQGFNDNNSNLCTPIGKHQATQFAEGILSTSSASYIDQQIYNIYANITGQIYGTNGVLYDMTTELILQVQDGADMLQCYYFLENYFGELTATQAQGLDLMIEAIHQTQGTLLAYEDNATQYYAKYQGQIDNETEIFLACVDRLVVSGINVRSQIVQPFSYLPTETATIYNRADFVASQLSSLQPAGLVIRLIGDPTHVADWIANNRITANGGNFTVVSVNGNTTNNYAAPIPTSGVNYYLEWTPNGTAYTFQQQDNISVVKLKLSASSPGPYTVISPTDNQTLSVAWYDIDFQQISSPDNNPDNATDNTSVLYGSGVFYARILPTWQSDTGVKTQDTKDQWSTVYTPDPADFSVYIQSTPCELYWWLSAPITYTGGIYTTIANGGADNVTVAFKWNAAQNTTNNWTTNQSGTGNQCLICQSVSQQANNNTTVTSDNFTLKPNTNTTVNYQVQQVLNSEFAKGLEYGFLFTTNAWINSLEIIPQP